MRRMMVVATVVAIVFSTGIGGGATPATADSHMHVAGTIRAVDSWPEGLAFELDLIGWHEGHTGQGSYHCVADSTGGECTSTGPVDLLPPSFATGRFFDESFSRSPLPACIYPYVESLPEPVALPWTEVQTTLSTEPGTWSIPFEAGTLRATGIRYDELEADGAGCYWFTSTYYGTVEMTH